MCVCVLAQMSWSAGIRGPCANAACPKARCVDARCYCTQVEDKPVILVLENMQAYEDNLDKLEAKFASIANYDGVGLGDVQSKVPGAERGTVNILAVTYGRQDRAVKVVFARGDVARAALALKHKFVDQQTVARLHGLAHTPFEPGCVLAHTVNVPGGTKAFRAVTASQQHRYHLDLLGEGNVQLCNDCCRACSSVDTPAAEAMREAHASRMIQAHHGLLSKPAQHALASLLTLLFWLTNQETGEAQAQREVWHGCVSLARDRHDRGV